MSGPWAELLSRLTAVLGKLAELWLAFKAGQWKRQKDAADAALDVKDEQDKIAAERPRDRDDLVRRLRERGF
jgi:hypothetical protein